MKLDVTEQLYQYMALLKAEVAVRRAVKRDERKSELRKTGEEIGSHGFWRLGYFDYFPLFFFFMGVPWAASVWRFISSWIRGFLSWKTVILSKSKNGSLDLKPT